jgi:hypothetical protein
MSGISLYSIEEEALAYARLETFRNDMGRILEPLPHRKNGGVWDTSSFLFFTAHSISREKFIESAGTGVADRQKEGNNPIIKKKRNRMVFKILKEDTILVHSRVIFSV